MITRRAAIAAGLGAIASGGLPAARAEDLPGVTATTLKIGNTMPYSGPASSYGVIGRTESRVFQDGQRAGRRRRTHDRFHLAR